MSSGGPKVWLRAQSVASERDDLQRKSADDDCNFYLRSHRAARHALVIDAALAEGANSTPIDDVRDVQVLVGVPAWGKYGFYLRPLRKCDDFPKS